VSEVSKGSGLSQVNVFELGLDFLSLEIMGGEVEKQTRIIRFLSLGRELAL